MPLVGSHANMVRMMIREYKNTGKIGSSHPENLQDAVDQANAIAYAKIRNRKRKKKKGN